MIAFWQSLQKILKHSPWGVTSLCSCLPKELTAWQSLIRADWRSTSMKSLVAPIRLLQQSSCMGSFQRIQATMGELQEFMLDSLMRRHCGLVPCTITMVHFAIIWHTRMRWLSKTTCMCIYSCMTHQLFSSHMWWVELCLCWWTNTVFTYGIQSHKKIMRWTDLHWLHWRGHQFIGRRSSSRFECTIPVPLLLLWEEYLNDNLL